MQEEHITFDITGAVVARAEMHRAARPRRGPPTPEHVLLVVEEDEVISELLFFYESHDPLDILEAYWNGSLDHVGTDEGIETSAELTPTAPPPTPTSSTEALQGSVDNSTDSNTTQNNTANDSSIQITEVIINNNLTIDIADNDDKTSNDDIEEEKEEEGKGGDKGDHAN